MRAPLPNTILFFALSVSPIALTQSTESRDLNRHIENLKATSQTTRKNAADQIGRFGSRAVSALPTIIERLQPDVQEGYEIRTSLIRDIGQIGQVDQTILDILSAALVDKYPNVRAEAVGAIMQLLQSRDESKYRAELLSRSLSACGDKFEFVRSALSELASVLSEEQLGVLEALLTAKSDSPTVECYGRLALRFKLSTSAVSIVAKLLQRSGENVDENALRAMLGLTDQCIGIEKTCYPLLPVLEKTVLQLRNRSKGISSPNLNVLDRNIKYLRLSESYRSFEAWQTPIADHPAAFAYLAWASVTLNLVFVVVMARFRSENKRRWELNDELTTERLAKLTSDHEKSLVAVSELHETRLATMRREHEAELSGIQATLTGRIDQERRKYENTLEERSLAAEVVAARTALSQFAPKPRPMERPDIRIASAFNEASTVSGDFFNWSVRHDGTACVYLVDVEGHGFEAASQAILSATILSRTILGADSLEPKASLEKADKLIRSELGESRIAVTMSLVQISPDRRRLMVANAGMPPALLFRFGQSAPEIVQAVGTFVGDGYERGRAQPKQVDTSVSIGDMIVLYSDGLSEARDEHGDLFGLSGISAIVAKHRHRTPNEVATALIKAVCEHSDRDSPEDDQMAIVIQLGPESSEYRISNAPTLEKIGNGEFALVNAVDSVSACDSQLFEFAKRFFGRLGDQRQREAWNALWEAVLNSINHGSSRGEVVSIRFSETIQDLSVEIEQPREWRDWDRFLRTNSADATQDGHLGTTLIRKLSTNVIVSKQGRCVVLSFVREE